MTLQNLLRVGKLKDHAPTAAEVLRLLAAVDRNLADAAVSALTLGVDNATWGGAGCATAQTQWERRHGRCRHARHGGRVHRAGRPIAGSVTRTSDKDSPRIASATHMNYTRFLLLNK